MLLRDKEIFDISSLSFAIIESNGRISIAKKPELETPTLKDLNLKPMGSNTPLTVIMEGKIEEDNIQALDVSEQDLQNLIETNGYSAFNEIFYASLSKEGKINISPYNLKE
jgi:uncharacterized membrane protein YcaP (DUF421 family)